MNEESLLSGQASTDAGTQQNADQGLAPAGEQGQQAAAEGQQAPAGQAEAPQGAPEAYEFQLPEGYELNAEIGEEFSAYAKELNLPQDKAQVAVDMGVKLIENFQARQAEQFQQQQQKWRDEVVNDKEIGGQMLNENLSYAAKVLDTYAPDLRQVLNETGMGNHPAFVKAFVKIGKAISEDRLVGGAQQQGQAPKDAAQVLFPNMN
jgi:hypothetical protein